MPQLDFTTYVPQLFWLAIIFAVLYVVMARRALPRITEVLEERQNRIDGDLEQAERYREESEGLEASYEKLIADARAKALYHLKAEREKVEGDLAERQAAMTADLEARLKAAEGKIMKAREKALLGVEDIAAEACTSIVAKLSGEALAKTTAKQAVKAAMGAK